MLWEGNRAWYYDSKVPLGNTHRKTLHSQSKSGEEGRGGCAASRRHLTVGPGVVVEVGVE